jgi:hypothetical protein
MVPTVASNDFNNPSPSPSASDLTRLSWDFENGVFPEPPWSTSGDGLWAFDQINVDEGTYSIKSPDLGGENSTVPLTSNATLTLSDDFIGGVLKLRVFARSVLSLILFIHRVFSLATNSLTTFHSVQPPRDIFSIYVDGESAAQIVDTSEWTDVVFSVAPGPHTIDLSYQYNIFGVDPLPPSPPERLGAVWIDNVVIESLPPAGRAVDTTLTILPVTISAEVGRE